MVGNLDYIIDAVSKKHNLDRRLVEVVAQETFRRFKSRINHTDALSLYVPKLGFFIPMNRKLRRYIGETVRSVRKIRIKMQEYRDLLNSNISEEERIELQRKLKTCEDIEKYNVNAIRTAWYQLDTLRYTIIEKKRKITEWRIKKQQEGDWQKIS